MSNDVLICSNEFTAYKNYQNTYLGDIFHAEIIGRVRTNNLKGVYNVFHQLYGN